MRIPKTILVLVLMAAASGVTWVYAQQQQRRLPSMLPAEDYLEILQLYGYYTRDTDAGSQRDASWMYTADGVWDHAGGRVIGAKDLKEYYLGAQARHKVDRSRHFATTPVIVPTQEGARGSLYMAQIERKAKGGPVEITLYGKYEDTLAKTPKGWRFKERKWRADTFHGDDTPVLPSPFAPVD